MVLRACEETTRHHRTPREVPLITHSHRRRYLRSPRKTNASRCDSSLPLMPYRIFFINELIVLIAEELIAYSKQDVVSLALTCRALEDPALTILWARNTILSNLIRVLPPDTLAYTLLNESTIHYCREEEVVSELNFPFKPLHVFWNPVSCYNIVKDPGKENWDRLRGIWIMDAPTPLGRTTG